MKKMFGLIDIFWTCLIAGSVFTVAIMLRSELKKGVLTPHKHLAFGRTYGNVKKHGNYRSELPTYISLVI